MSTMDDPWGTLWRRCTFALVATILVCATVLVTVGAIGWLLDTMPWLLIDGRHG